MSESAELFLISVVGVVFIWLCVKLGGVGNISRETSPRAFWFGIGMFGLMTAMLFVAAIWSAVSGR